MPLVNTNPNPTTTMGSLAGLYSNFASMMAANKQTQNDAASARLNDAKTIAQEFENKGRQSAYEQAMSMMPQQGTQVNTDENGVMTAGDTPWTPEQNNQRLTVRAQAGYLGYGKQTADLFDTNNQGLTTNKFTGDKPGLNQDEQTQMAQQTLALNAAKIAKDQASAAADDPNKWDNSYTTTWRGEWKKEHIKKAYDVLNEAQRAMESFYESSGETDSNIPDYSLIVKYAKLLDPDSVVRSSEVDAIINETGVGGIINSLASKVTGGGRLTAKERDAFMAASRKVTNAVRKAAMKKQTIYQNKARGGGRFGDVVIDPIRDQEYSPLRTSPEYKAQQAGQNKAAAKAAYKQTYDEIKAQHSDWSSDQIISETNRRTGNL